MDVAHLRFPCHMLQDRPGFDAGTRVQTQGVWPIAHRLYTDGSAIFPQLPWCRLASWAVVAVTDEGQPQTMAAGLVPRSFAPYQTVADGEIYAVLQALKFTSDHVVVHCDCLLYTSDAADDM
eukprot:11066131-Prorocentrum_lima.AAC.1